MTLEEAKKILKKEGYSLKKATDYHPSQAGFFDGVLKCAVATVNANGYMVIYNEFAFKELVGSSKAFNDSLLDEQAKKIKDLEKRNIILNEKVVTMSKELGAERCTSKILIEKFNEIRSLKKKLRKMRSIADGFRKEINTLTSRIIDFRKSIKEKDEVIEDISEELRLSKKREEELVETVKDYLALVGDKDEEIKKLKKKLESTEKARKEYCDYGVGANNLIKKICSAYVNAHERGVYSLEALIAGRRYRYNGLFPKDAFEYAKEEKSYNKKNIFAGVDVGSDEGDKVCVGAFSVYNEVPICKDLLTIDELIEIQKKLFRKAPF